MFTTIMAKIKLGLTIGVSVIIIGLIITIFVYHIKSEKLNNKVIELKADIDLLNSDKLALEAELKIANDFTNSSAIIAKLTNEIVFDDDKQNALDNILNDFYEGKTNK